MLLVTRWFTVAHTTIPLVNRPTFVWMPHCLYILTSRMPRTTPAAVYALPWRMTVPTLPRLLQYRWRTPPFCVLPCGSVPMRSRVTVHVGWFIAGLLLTLITGSSARPGLRTNRHRITTCPVLYLAMLFVRAVRATRRFHAATGWRMRVAKKKLPPASYPDYAQRPPLADCVPYWFYTHCFRTDHRRSKFVAYNAPPRDYGLNVVRCGCHGPAYGSSGSATTP